MGAKCYSDASWVKNKVTKIILAERNVETFNFSLNVKIVWNLFVSSGPRPWPWLWDPICIYRPWRLIFIHRSWPPTCITSPGSQFVFTGHSLQIYYQSGAWVCIYQPGLLNLYLCLQPWPTICITGPGSEIAFILLLVVEAVVVIIVVGVIFLE